MPEELLCDLFRVSMLELPLLEPAVLIDDPPEEPELMEMIELGRFAPVTFVVSVGGIPMKEFRNFGARKARKIRFLLVFNGQKFQKPTFA